MFKFSSSASPGNGFLAIDDLVVLFDLHIMQVRSGVSGRGNDGNADET